MYLQKRTLRHGDGVTFPHAGDIVRTHYTGWLYNASRNENKGRQFDSSSDRGLFQSVIGVGRVIRGWDVLIPQMSLGEKSSLTIPSSSGYGPSGFPGFIPAEADLIFEVELVEIIRAETSPPA